MENVVLMREGYTSFLDALTEDLLVYLHLYTNDPTLTETLTGADFTEPAHEGYSPLAIGGWTPSRLEDAVAVSFGEPPAFTYTSGPEPDPIRGYFATFGVSGPVLWGFRRPGGTFPLGAGNPLLTINTRMTFPFSVAADGPALRSFVRTARLTQPATNPRTRAIDIAPGGVGDLCIVLGGGFSNVDNITDPPGWTRFVDRNMTGAAFKTAGWYRFRQEGDPAQVTWTWTSATTTAWLSTAWINAGVPNHFASTGGPGFASGVTVTGTTPAGSGRGALQHWSSANGANTTSSVPGGCFAVDVADSFIASSFRLNVPTVEALSESVLLGAARFCSAGLIWIPPA